MEPKEVMPRKRGRRTREEIEASRGAVLAKEVERLSLSQLAAFAAAMNPEVAEFVTSRLAQRS